MEVRLPDGVVVLAQGRLGLVPAERPGVPDFALYVDARWDGDPAVTWPHLMVEWPDFALPVDEVGLFEAVVGLQQRAAGAWVRAVYHPAAVETPAQEALVERFGAWWAGQPG